MLQFDQESQTVRRSALGLSGTAAGHGRVLDDLAREIEDMQRQQSETMTHILERLRATGSRPSGMRATQSFLNVDVANADAAGDGPWDADAAEALMRSYEENGTGAVRPALRQPMSRSQQDWIGERFNDVTHRITQALSSLKPGSAIAVLEERLDAFQELMSSALRDVVRRDDLEGLRMIEAHVNDLGDKLQELEQHLLRIDGIESDVRNVMAQVSDERIAKLLDYDARFAADLEAVAKRAAEEVHARFGHDGEQTRQDARRHEELRALIEASIRDRREAEAQAVSLVTGLSGRVSAQADRYDELKALLEQAIQEQRQNEQTAFGMLDTLQQALVTVLDRMDALEQQYQTAAVPAEPARDEPVRARAFEASYPEESLPPRLPEAPATDEPAYGFRDTRFDGFHAHDEPEQTVPVEVPAAFAEPALETDAAADEADSSIERLRRDFVADARRAKLKAAANRAEALSAETEPQKPDSIAQARAALAQIPRVAQGTGSSGRLFGMSTKLLAGVLALIIAINAGLVLLNRKSSPPAAPKIATEPYSRLDVAPEAPAHDNGETPDRPASAPNPGARSDAGDGQATGGQSLTLYGFQDDVLDPPAVETLEDGAASSDVPQGVALARPAGSLPDEAVAGVYEQQVLASLSGKLGMIAAGQSADALLPEQNGRIETAYPAPEISPGNADAEASSALDLPPATVGPMSLRLAAANGDASAEFEVAARLAEGKGTSQDYAEALRWYQRSAAKGFAQAQYRLGTLYERGLGVAKDLERAKVWYGRAAEGGNVKAMHNLAVLIAGGEQGEPDYKAAAPWFRKAAEHGLADSQYNLGVLLENGLAGEIDQAGAYMWYALAAKGGDQDAVARRDALKSTLGATALKSAETKIAGFRARRAAPLANDARAAGEDWKKRVNNDTNT